MRFLLAFLALLCLPALATTYPMPAPGNDIIGQVLVVHPQSGETLASLGLRYGMSYHEMIEANPTINKSVALRHGQKIVIPAQFILPPVEFRKGIVVNMAELRLYYFPPGGQYVMTFPVAMGRDQWRSPVIATSVSWKEPNPIWRVPDSIRDYTFENTGKVLPDQVLPGPDNPLGPFAIHLAAAGYLIHGNNSPTSIGKFVSSGCIRMRNEDITTLYPLVKVGTPVYIIHYPNKVGWFNGNLYLESQVPVELDDQPSNLNQTSVESAVDSELTNKTAVINWDTVKQVTEQHRGIPEQIGYSAKTQASSDPIESAPPLPLTDDPFKVQAQATDDNEPSASQDDPSQQTTNSNDFSDPQKNT
jgi:L,D-transpeptidase ErfK/SrfK